MATRPRALFIGINQRYINATNSLLPSMLQRSCDVRFFGPGFVHQDTLAAGVESYVDAIGGVDIVLVTNQCAAGMDADRLNTYLGRYTALLNGGRVTVPFLDDVGAFCRRNRGRTICALTDLDPHGVQQHSLDAVLERAGYFLCWGNGFLDALGDSDAVRSEAYLQKRLQRAQPLGLFDRFADANRAHMINLGHMVADSEFYWSTLGVRRYDAAVPGSGYARRKRVLTALKSSRDLRVRGLGYMYLFKAAQRLRLRPYANFYLVHLYNLAFQRALGQTRACVTDGGGNNFPVRKFLEIPAAGAVMVCWPSVGLESLGFRDGVHAVFVSSEDQAVDAVRQIARDAERFEPMASAGRALVHERHTTAARGAQLACAVSGILSGTFSGSSWADGQFDAKCAVGAAPR
jgi:hypothetical protein